MRLLMDPFALNHVMVPLRLRYIQRSGVDQYAGGRVKGGGTMCDID